MPVLSLLNTLCGRLSRIAKGLGIALIAVGALVLVVCLPFKLWLGLLGAALVTLGVMMLSL